MNLIPALLGRLDAERAHEWAIRGLRWLEGQEEFLKSFYGVAQESPNPRLKQTVADLEFLNPVGLAAGWDKNAVVVKPLSALGFGFLELGTVTLWPEQGNPRPRIFRDQAARIIVNRVGFANDGAFLIRERLKHLSGIQNCLMGVSLGKMRSSPARLLVSEVLEMLEMFYPYGAFFSVNVSSPNTPQGFLMGQADFLTDTLVKLKKENRLLAHRLGRLPKPIFVKVAPMINDRALMEVAAALRESEVDGVIVSNTLPTPEGGLSGLPLKSVALQMTARFYHEFRGRIPIIGVGGILTPADAWERILAGASLIQIYSGFVFEGPGLIGKICGFIDQQLAAMGFERLSQAVGLKAEEICGRNTRQ